MARVYAAIGFERIGTAVRRPALITGTRRLDASAGVRPSSQPAARLTAETTALSEAVTMFASMPDAPEDAVADRALDVRRRPRVATGGQRVLGVVEDAHVVRRPSCSASTNAAIGPLPRPVSVRFVAVDDRR